ncbi:MAG: YkgJ family cysteine cluster protein [Chlorobiaceae bacterium]|nr:YkgJ family cysteine cluster protein [Chlorobiaceae bacterium]
MRCLKCCESKKIQVNPYEIARLARNLGISTTEFIAGYTDGNGTFLKFDEQNRCTFLGPEGCLVHADRPLVCRLYPLGRHFNDRKEEWFSEIEPDTECRGEYGDDTSIENYLAEQEVQAYTQAADSYLDLLWEMMNLLEETADDEGASADSGSTSVDERDMPENGEWLDMDMAVRNHCLRKGQPCPLDLDEKTRMHQEVIRLWIKQS